VPQLIHQDNLVLFGFGTLGVVTADQQVGTLMKMQMGILVIILVMILVVMILLAHVVELFVSK
jgi:hypothetical protein